MEESVLQEISKVFGFSQEESKEFLDKMDMNTEVDKEYFTAVLDKLKKPTIVEFPEKPQEPMLHPAFASFNNNMKQRMKNRHIQRQAKYQENMVVFQEKVSQFQAAPQTNNTIAVNEGRLVLNNQGTKVGNASSGEYGYVKRNRKSPYIYKFLIVPKNELTDETIRKILTEPLINCILQQDSIAEPITCKLYKFYGRPLETGYEFIFKMEDIKGDSLTDAFAGKLGGDKDANFALLVRVFGPFLEVLQILRQKYSFEHGDLHGDNLMFVQKPNFQEKKNLEMKMIDFGYSSMKVGTKQIGKVRNPYIDSHYVISRAQWGFLSNDITKKIMELFDTNDLNGISLYIINSYKTMQGGRRRQTRKQKSKRGKTRKH